MKINKLIITVIIIAIMMFFVSCNNKVKEEFVPEPASSAEKTEYIKITAQEAKKMMDENDNIIIVDVRTEDEFSEKHIEGAILIPNESIGNTMPDKLPKLDARILVYCRSGNRSRQAAEKLIELGYTQVYDFGGINDWPYDTIGE